MTPTTTKVRLQLTRAALRADGAGQLRLQVNNLAPDEIEQLIERCDALAAAIGMTWAG
jgi:hypothetical protein